MRLPAEWEPQEAIWLSWPALDTHWDEMSSGVMQKKWAEITAIISHSQLVRLNAPGGLHRHILKLLNSACAELSSVELFDHPNNDVWCRDHGALFCEHNQSIVATDWRFNGWGEAFLPYDLDDQIAKKMGESQGVDTVSYQEVLEGGAIEVNGQGVVLTTEAVLLNANRNPLHSKAQVETMLCERLGGEKVVWLGQGIEGDDTGGHIDDIARFVAARTVLVSSARGGYNRGVLEENYQRLKDWGGADIIKMPMPEACEVPGWRLPVLPASYVNFLITNELVLVPTFRQPRNDGFALGLFKEYFPSRRVVGIDCLEVVREGGALHCISMQQGK